MSEALKELQAATFLNETIEEEVPRLAELVKEIEETILLYVELESKELATLLALWIVQSYRIETFAFCGFLGVQSASIRCGKSRLPAGRP